MVLFGTLFVFTPIRAENISDLAIIKQSGGAGLGFIEDATFEEINPSRLSPEEHYEKLIFHKVAFIANREYRKLNGFRSEGKITMVFSVFPDGKIKDIIVRSNNSNPKIVELAKKVIKLVEPLPSPPNSLELEGGIMTFVVPFNFYER